MNQRLFAVLAAALMATSAQAAPPPGDDPPASKPAPKAGSSLDDELLKGLGDDPLLDLDKPRKPAESTSPDADKPGKPAPAARPKTADPLDEELLKGLGETSPETDNPFVRITRQMREVEELIRQAKSGAATQDRQQEIVKQLEKLIEELEQRQQQSSSSSSSQQQQRQQQTAGRDKVQQPDQPGSPRAGQPQQGQDSSQPAKDSADRQGKPETRKPDMAQMRDLLKDIWGELPPRLRQQMMQSAVEKFLPKYELQIEEYFKTLSEEQGRK